MAGKLNPTKLTWRHSGKNTDGSNFDPAQFHGWEVEINDQLTVSVPVGWETDGEYEAPIAQLELPEGEYELRLRLAAKNGTFSDWSNATEFEIRKVPESPLEFSAV